MYNFPVVFRRFGPQAWYILMAPLFFLLFVILYRPSSVVSFLSEGGSPFDYKLSICVIILIGSQFSLRMLFYSLKQMHMRWGYYIIWCVGEMLVASFLMSLYLYLSAAARFPYLHYLSASLGMVFEVLPYAYAVITLSLAYYSVFKFPDDTPAEHSLMRFYDENRKLKLVVSDQAVLYVEAEENYVRIHYLDGDTRKEYLLRMTMKGIEPVASGHGLVRCHRSYFINPSHVEILRKDKEGGIFAQFGAVPGLSIPVSKKYYDALSKML